ncbi:MAG: hypothetical protein FJ006_12655 [Chloroflexi bacterium]|nr:hypothetical protein [Chloroflexota bacterium]
MDIVALIEAVLKESATAALALFAIWSVKQLYEQRIREREDYATRLESINAVLIQKLEEGNRALAVNAEVVRANTEALNELRRLIGSR